ncbi:MAG: surface protein [Gemmatales bacterium]|nr:MAG: surface protein [Gemmatales bacterium]
MSWKHTTKPVLLALAALVFAGQANADLYDTGKKPTQEVKLPAPAEIQELSVSPKEISLIGRDDAKQLILTAKLTSGRLQDLTTNAKYEPANDKIVRVTSTGRVIPLANGSTTVTAEFGGKKVSINVKVEKADVDLPINFGNQIVPIFTKLGCNSGGCHGKASGQNGFKLSLLGFEPDFDYAALVKEGRGRRLFPASPENSLLLLKAVGAVAHAGGKRMEVGSDEYRLIRRWIASGMPFGSPDDPVVEKISIYPQHRIMTFNNKQQFAVYAHYTDGTVEDITRRAQYESNDTEVAVVDEEGLVHTLNMSGEAAIMARYQGHVTVFRATVPTGLKVPNYEFPYQTLVDRHTHNKWQQLGLMPSPLCSDEEFIRRVYLDITGTLPTPDEVHQFVADKDPHKRDKLVDELLETREYSYYFAKKWADILHVRRPQNEANAASGTFAFHSWIRNAIASDMPYDEFVRGILTATGDETRHAPVVWYKTITRPEQFVDDMAQVFLGQRLACAQCHHHPYEKWSQDDYWGLAAFYGRVGRKTIPRPGSVQNNRVQQDLTIYTMASGSVRNKKNNEVAPLKPLDDDPIEVPSGEDPRQRLVDWMANPNNPFFARAVVNRYWAHFFGRGIVDPLDDMRVTNPPSNPELLDALAEDLIKNKFSLKHLIRTICKSRTYQLSSTPNEFNKHDKQAYARYYPKRMTAEVLFDAVCQVTNSFTTFNGLPQDRYAPNRAIMLPDSSYQSYFLDVFGRPQGISACECERVSEANLAQALHLLNSDEVQNKIARAGGRADLLAKDKRPDAEKVEELFYWAFAHKPTKEQLDKALAHIEKHASNKKLAYENIIWALLNTKEFIFNK